MLQRKWPFLDLTRFDGGSGGAGGEGGTGGTQAAPSAAGKGNTGGDSGKVLYGKQAPQEAPKGSSVAGESKTTGKKAPAERTPEERRKAYKAMIEGEFKDLYTEDTQRIIDRRFRQSREAEERLGAYQPIIELLSQRYKIGDGDLKKLTQAIENDDAYWSEAAEEAGMSVEQYKQFQKLQRENAELMRRQRARQNEERAQQQLQNWFEQAQGVKEKFPGFDLDTEVKNPQFLAMLKAGTPVEHAYKVLHFDELMGQAVSVTAAQQEQKVVAQVRARGARPAENGTAAQGGFTVKDDVSRLSRKDRAEIARRAQMGEIITF